MNIRSFCEHCLPCLRSHIAASPTPGRVTACGRVLPDRRSASSLSDGRVEALRDLRQHFTDNDDSIDGTMSTTLADWQATSFPRRARRRAIIINPNSNNWTTETLAFFTQPLEIDVSTEETLLHSAMKGLSEASAPSLRKEAFQVTFRGQLGVDAGGVRRDFFARIGQVLCQTKYGLLMPAADGQMQLRPTRANDDLPSWWWEALGRLLASAVLHEEPLGIHFVPPFCKQLLGTEVTFDDLEAVHPEWFRAMRSLRKFRVISARTLPEEPSCMILETNGTHGAQPGESVHIQGFAEMNGQHNVLHVLGLQATELAISIESSISQRLLAESKNSPQPLLLRRHASDEANMAMSCMDYNVPSRSAILKQRIAFTERSSSTSSMFSALPSLAHTESAESPTKSPDKQPSNTLTCSSTSPLNSRPGALNRVITPELTTNNFEEYVAAATCKLLCRNIEGQLKAIKRGFGAVLGDRLREDWCPERWTRLRELLRGQPSVDLTAWRNATRAKGFPSNESGNQVIDWWFKVLNRAQPDFQQVVLRWSTGLAAMPSEGWPQGDPFVLQRSGADADHMPQAHTCSFTVDIPKYTSEEQLELKLRRAVEELDFGFG